MKLHDAAAMMNDLMAEHGLTQSGWTWRWGKGVKTMGMCFEADKLLVLYKPYTEAQDDVDDVRDTILHEIAHALAGNNAGHGPAWKAMARSIGCNARRTGSNPAYTAHLERLAAKRGDQPAAAMTVADEVRVQSLRVGDRAMVSLVNSKWHGTVGTVVNVTAAKVYISTAGGTLHVPKKCVRPA